MALLVIDWQPPTNQLRRFGIIGGAVFGALGAWAYFGGGLFGFDLSPAAAGATGCALWAVGAVCLLLAAVWPKAIRPLYVALNVVTWPIGYVLSHIVLFLVFFLVITPMAIVFRLIGRDAMNRTFDHSADSYWIRLESQPPAERYFRQF